MAWSFDAHLPVSVQLTERIRMDILGGKYPPGTQFPTVRSLAYEASVNPNTMQKALVALEDEGILIPRGTTGRFVTEDLSLLAKKQAELKKAYMRRALTGARELGICAAEFISFIESEEQQ